MEETAKNPPVGLPPNGEEIQHVERRSSGAGCIVVGVVFLVVFYVLSPPLVFLMLGGPPPPGNPMFTFVTIFYFPLEWMYQEVPFVRAFYDWYFEATGVR
jgi:hypothetical protein